MDKNTVTNNTATNYKYTYRNGPPNKSTRKSHDIVSANVNKFNPQKHSNNESSLSKLYPPTLQSTNLREANRKKKQSKKKNKNVSSAFDSVNISVKMISGKSLRRKKEKRAQLCKQIDNLTEEEIRFILMKVGIQTSRELPRSMLVSLAKCYFFN